MGLDSGKGNHLLGRVNLRRLVRLPLALTLALLVTAPLATPVFSSLPGPFGPLLPGERGVHHIRTSTQYADGTKEVRHGTGFVVGHQFFTVFHNIDVLKNHGSFKRQIHLGGVVVEPRLVDERNDIAIFDLPTQLCNRWCNDSDPRAMPQDLSHEQPIGWFEFVSLDEERQWRQAHIVEVMFKNFRSDQGFGACESDVVITVDQPFYPGSSGGPVWDLASNRLLGMVQGSFVRESGEQVGYYKPFSCVQSLLNGQPGPLLVELAASNSR